MGSDKKSKEKRKRDSDDEVKSSKKHRDIDEKSDKKESRKDKKSHKHRSSEEKKSKDKSKSKKHDRPLKLDIPELSSDDYFAKNNEFATWLKEKKKIFFSDLSSESAREMFQDFVSAWNKQKLDSRYYEGIATAPRTAHNWKIKNVRKSRR